MNKEGMTVGDGDVLYGEGRLEQAQAAMSTYIERGMPGGHTAFIAASDLMVGQLNGEPAASARMEAKPFANQPPIYRSCRAHIMLLATPLY